jgi:hypothetical protein
MAARRGRRMKKPSLTSDGRLMVKPLTFAQLAST